MECNWRVEGREATRGNVGLGFEPEIAQIAGWCTLDAADLDILNEPPDVPVPLVAAQVAQVLQTLHAVREVIPVDFRDGLGGGGIWVGLL